MASPILTGPHFPATTYYKNLKLAGDLPSYKLENADPVQLERHVVPRNYSVAPVVAKIEILFTFSRCAIPHGPWFACKCPRRRRTRTRKP